MVVGTAEHPHRPHQLPRWQYLLSYLILHLLLMAEHIVGDGGVM